MGSWISAAIAVPIAARRVNEQVGHIPDGLVQRIKQGLKAGYFESNDRGLKTGNFESNDKVLIRDDLQMDQVEMTDDVWIEQGRGEKQKRYNEWGDEI